MTNEELDELALPGTHDGPLSLPQGILLILSQLDVLGNLDGALRQPASV